MQSELIKKGILLPSGEICKDKINLVSGATTAPFAEMVWITTGQDEETIHGLRDLFLSMNTPQDRPKLFKLIKVLYGLMGLEFSSEAALMGDGSAVLEYYIFSFLSDFEETMMCLQNDGFEG